MNKEAQRQNLLYARTSDKLCDAEAEIKQLKARITELETITDEKVERVARVIYEYKPLIEKGGEGFTAYVKAYKFEELERLKRSSYIILAKAALEAAIGGDDE